MGFLYRHYASNESKSLSNNGDNVIYGSSWSFARWVTDTYGGADEGTFLRSLVQQQNERGLVNIQNRTGRTWTELLGYFSLASASDNYPGGTITDARARLQSWNTRDIFATMSASLRFATGPPSETVAHQHARVLRDVPVTTSNVFTPSRGGFAARRSRGRRRRRRPRGFAASSAAHHRQRRDGGGAGEAAGQGREAEWRHAAPALGPGVRRARCE
jgi:hypothetical protein